MLIKIYRISFIVYRLYWKRKFTLLLRVESHKFRNFEYCSVEFTFISNIVFVFRCERVNSVVLNIVCSAVFKLTEMIVFADWMFIFYNFENFRFAE